MKPYPALLAATALALAPLAHAQTAATDPVGYVKVEIPAQSDAAVSAPLNRPPVFSGRIEAIDTNNGVITVSLQPNWASAAPKEFSYVQGSQPNTYFAQIASGDKEGMWAKITDNGSNTVTIELNPGDDLNSIITNATDGNSDANLGDSINIHPFWTPKTLFPSTWPNGTAVFLYPDSTIGINLAAADILSLVNGNWLKGLSNANDFLILPNESYVIRNGSNTQLTFIPLGAVSMVAHRRIISTLAASKQQDQRISYSSPIPETIGQTGLGFSNGDTLLVFDITKSGFNKSAAVILSYVNGRWLSGLTDVTGTFMLEPGRGYVFRKAATVSPTDIEWQDTQSYLE